MTNLFSARKLAGIPALALAAVAVLATAALPADAQGRREREHRPLPPVGEPGRVAAADFAFAKAAREEGQWTAFRNTMQPGAVIHTPAGLTDAAQWLEGRADPAEAVRWAPGEVWSSCDGTLAASIGRFTNPDRAVGSYVTVWVLQDDRRSYRWIYDVGALDNPQPPPPMPNVEPGPDTIVVEELVTINGHVADCPAGGSRRRGGPDQPVRDASGIAASDDSLRLSWEHVGTGTRVARIEWVQDGAWEEAYRLTIPPATGE